MSAIDPKSPYYFAPLIGRRCNPKSEEIRRKFGTSEYEAECAKKPELFELKKIEDQSHIFASEGKSLTKVVAAALRDFPACDPTKVREAVRSGFALFTSTKEGDENDDSEEWSEENLKALALEKIRFPRDCWMPLDIASQWKSTLFPLENSPASFAAWETELRKCQAAAIIGSNLKREAQAFRDELEHDSKLLAGVAKTPAKRKRRKKMRNPAVRTATRNKGGRPRSAEVEEVQAYLYTRWIKGDKLAAIRAGAKKKFGNARAPKEDAHVTDGAQRYARKKGLPTKRPT